MMSSYTADEIKHHESQMEGRSHKQMIDNVQLMVEQISFSKPMSNSNITNIIRVEDREVRGGCKSFVTVGDFDETG
jgi:hypothetical protein